MSGAPANPAPLPADDNAPPRANPPPQGRAPPPPPPTATDMNTAWDFIASLVARHEEDDETDPFHVLRLHLVSGPVDKKFFLSRNSLSPTVYAPKP